MFGCCFCEKQKKELDGVAVCLDGIVTNAAMGGKMLLKK